MTAPCKRGSTGMKILQVLEANKDGLPLRHIQAELPAMGHHTSPRNVSDYIQKLLKRGVIRADDRRECSECGHPHRAYVITPLGKAVVRGEYDA